jgi:hypothetical protein
MIGVYLRCRRWARFLTSPYSILIGFLLQILGSALCFTYGPPTRKNPQQRFVWEDFPPLALLGSVMFVSGAVIFMHSLSHRRRKAARKYLKPTNGGPQD